MERTELLLNDLEETQLPSKTSLVYVCFTKFKDEKKRQKLNKFKRKVSCDETDTEL